MSAASTESIMVALFNLLSAAAGFKTASRRLIDIAQTNAFPALYQYEGGPALVKQQGLHVPNIVEISVKAIVYFDSPESTPVVSTQMNTLYDAIITALAPPPYQTVQDLGGLVQDCRISGEVIREPGDIDYKGLLVFPIKIFVTN